MSPIRWPSSTNDASPATLGIEGSLLKYVVFAIRVQFRKGSVLSSASTFLFRVDRFELGGEDLIILLAEGAGKTV